MNKIFVDLDDESTHFLDDFNDSFEIDLDSSKKNKKAETKTKRMENHYVEVNTNQGKRKDPWRPDERSPFDFMDEDNFDYEDFNDTPMMKKAWRPDDISPYDCEIEVNPCTDCQYADQCDGLDSMMSSNQNDMDPHDCYPEADMYENGNINCSNNGGMDNIDGCPCPKSTILEKKYFIDKLADGRTKTYCWMKETREY